MAPRPRRNRRWLPLVLLLATVATLTFANASWWEFRGWTLDSFLRSIYRYTLPVLAILGAHEMGHYIACRIHRIPATLPHFIPGIPPLGTFGALIRIRGAIPDRRALFDVAAAGPIAGFVVAIPVMAVGLLQAVAAPDGPPPEGVLLFGDPLLLTLLQRLLIDDPSIYMNSWLAAGWAGMLVTSLNLFPVGQLDGGHVAYAFSRRFHRRLTYATLAGLAGLIAWQGFWLRMVPAYMLWFVILVWMRDRHPRVLDEHTPLDPRRKAVALLLVAIFVLSFLVIPIRVT